MVLLYIWEEGTKEKHGESQDDITRSYFPRKSGGWAVKPTSTTPSKNHGLVENVWSLQVEKRLLVEIHNTYNTKGLVAKKSKKSVHMCLL